jgi:hypothetical protein
MTNPQVSHMDVARHILKFLKSISTHEILFKLGNTQPLAGYVDVDWEEMRTHEDQEQE